jgi:hypothetical protein
MTLGNKEWCTSLWHSVYYRVWRLDPSGAKLLIDGSEIAYQRTGAYVIGSIGRDWENDSGPVDAVIEYARRGVDTDLHETVRHFLIDGDKVRRVDPVALSPRDFVDEWLTREWKESSTWSASAELQRWHRKMHADVVWGGFSYTMHCQTPDLWQVTFRLDRAVPYYFLVRWRPPYHFTMTNVSDKPWPRCTEKDPEADAWRTLFSTQEWR